MTFVFWLSTVLIVYIYVGYPLCLWLLVKFQSPAPLPVAKECNNIAAAFQPSVVVLIAAYNEASVIRENIENKLAQDYPSDKMRIIVISDESDDGTDDIVKDYADRQVVLLRQSPRQGKTSGLNLAINWLQQQNDNSEIIVFADANSIYAEHTISKLVESFQDQTVGYVTGKMIYVNADGSIAGDGCSAYMKYENMMRAQETLIGSVVGVDGGVDAMRRTLHSQLNADQLPDFVQPLKVVEQGYRVAYEPEAILKEESLDDPEREFKMRVRVGLRALWALHDMRQLMNPKRFGLFGWQLISHKLLRYLAFIPLLLVFISSVILFNSATVYTIALAIQVVFYLLAWRAHQKNTIANASELRWYYALPYYFTLLNVACALALTKYLKGEKMVIWKPRSG